MTTYYVALPFLAFPWIAGNAKAFQSLTLSLARYLGRVAGQANVLPLSGIPMEAWIIIGELDLEKLQGFRHGHKSQVQYHG